VEAIAMMEYMEVVEVMEMMTAQLKGVEAMEETVGEEEEGSELETRKKAVEVEPPEEILTK
jgi:hypothetical protein